MQQHKSALHEAMRLMCSFSSTTMYCVISQQRRHLFITSKTTNMPRVHTRRCVFNNSRPTKHVSGLPELFGTNMKQTCKNIRLLQYREHVLCERIIRDLEDFSFPTISSQQTQIYRFKAHRTTRASQSRYPR